MKTKLAAIYNVWDGEELLEGSINCLKGNVDLLIIVWQQVSNIGEVYFPQIQVKDYLSNKTILEKYEPSFGISAGQNEVAKRNIGLEIAKREDCTHFFHMDVDEYYKDFVSAKKEFFDSGKQGSVCRIWTYFKKPTWRLENLDGFYVPFIHELNEDTRAGNSSYPFYVDPTRTITPYISSNDIVRIMEPMHHFSWVRDDIGRKVRSSSAAQYGNNMKGLLDDYHSLTDENVEGYVLKDMGGQRLKVVENIFGI